MCFHLVTVFDTAKTGKYVKKLSLSFQYTQLKTFYWLFFLSPFLCAQMVKRVSVLFELNCIISAYAPHYELKVSIKINFDNPI